MDNFIDKLARNFSFDNMDMTSEINNNLLKSKVFENLINKLENKEEKIVMDPNLTIVDKQEPEDVDLPYFGTSPNKSTKEVKFQPNNSMERFINDTEGKTVVNPSHNLHGQPSQQIQMNQQLSNPNNTLKNESILEGIENAECTEDDSIFIEGDPIDQENKKLNNKFKANQQLDDIIKSNINSNIFAIINTNQEPDSSSFFHNSQSMIIHNEDSHSVIDEYVDDDDPGFDLYECEVEYFKETCKKLSDQYDFPRRAVIKSKFKNNENHFSDQIPDKKAVLAPGVDLKSIKPLDLEQINSKKNINGEVLYELENINTENAVINTNTNNTNNTAGISAPPNKKILLPPNVKFMESGSSYYPVQFNNVIYDCFNLKIIVDRERTGFEESKEFKIVINSLIAGRYQVITFLGSAAFSKAIKCLDIVENRLVCLKIIENNKDYVDQSIDEIKLLRYINANGDSETKNFLKLYDYFYHKEHLFIVTELLKDNLYDFYKYLNENNVEQYFTLGRLKKISIQILTCLEFLHSLKLIHCDLKPENILIKSISDVMVKVIDFGSSCFIHDHLSSYVQSRSYRAPEVIIGCRYDYKVDMWSLGCILAELFTGNVLFQNDSIQSLLARIIGIIGPFPDWMFDKGKLVNDYFSKEKLLFMEINESVNNTGDNVFANLSKSNHSTKQKKKMHIIIPKRTQLKKRIKSNDENFNDFLKSLLEIDPNLRMSATDALNHPWITQSNYNT